MDQQEGGNSSMFDFDMNKEYSIPIDTKLRTLRIRRHPVQVDDSLIVKDCLESEGEISLYRRICDDSDMTIDDPVSCIQNRNDRLMATMKVMVFPDKKEVHICKMAYEAGQEALIPILWEKILYFAGFYDCIISIAKNPKISLIDEAV